MNGEFKQFYKSISLFQFCFISSVEVLFETCSTQFIKNGDISLRKKGNLNINARSTIQKKAITVNY